MKPEYHKLLSTFAFNLNLRRYSVAARLYGREGKGLLALNRATGARVHVEHAVGLRKDDEQPR